MKKILFVNIDLLKKEVEGIEVKKYRNQFIHYADELCADDEENEIVFVSMHQNVLDEAKKYFTENLRKTHYNFFNRRYVREFVNNNKNRNNYFVFVSGKEVDFHVAVNCKSLFIVPTWIPVDEKSEYYGVHVDTPEQLFKFIRALNNQKNWYSRLEIQQNEICFSLMDARYGYFAKSKEEREILIHFQNLLKENKSRNYYEILLYHFLAGMTNTTLFDDIELFGMIPSSDCTLNEDMYKFMTQVRYIKGKRLPKNRMEDDNLLIRHTPKRKAHNAYSPMQRCILGAVDEFSTMCINPEFKNKIETLKKAGRFNVLIFDDYVTHGNTFNAVRNLLEAIGVNKIIFVALGSFGKTFKKVDYKLTGSVYKPEYGYEVISREILSDFEIENLAKDEVAELYDIFNS